MQETWVQSSNGKRYYLHSKPVAKRKTTVRYFSFSAEGAIPIPTDCEVVFSQRSGLPFLRKIPS